MQMCLNILPSDWIKSVLLSWSVNLKKVGKTWILKTEISQSVELTK